MSVMLETVEGRGITAHAYNVPGHLQLGKRIDLQ